MEYQELVQASIAERDRQAARMALAAEARRLNPANGHHFSPGARFDSLVIRAGNGAKARQERRIGNRTPGQMA